MSECMCECECVCVCVCERERVRVSEREGEREKWPLPNTEDANAFFLVGFKSTLTAAEYEGRSLEGHYIRIILLLLQLYMLT